MTVPRAYRSRENDFLSDTQFAIIQYLKDHPIFTSEELTAAVRQHIAVYDPMPALSRLRRRGLVSYLHIGKGKYELLGISQLAREVRK